MSKAITAKAADERPSGWQLLTERLVWGLLWLGFGVACFSLVGYATFGLHPGWLQLFPGEYARWAAAFYQVSFRLFGEGQSWLLVIIFTLYLSHRVGMKWLAACVAVYAISLGAELAGTLWGVPFGAYQYTALMGPGWGGHVPYVIPASWWMMGLTAFAMAVARYPEHQGKAILLGALWLTLWDVSLDPAMSYLTQYWQWQQPGGFYGMPWQNWLGWYATSLVLMAVLHMLRVTRWLKALDIRWLVGFYVLNVIIPFGMLTVAGVWGAVLVNVVVLGICGYLWHPPSLMDERKTPE